MGGKAQGPDQEGQAREYEDRSIESLLAIASEHAASIMDRMETINAIIRELKERFPMVIIIVISTIGLS